MLFADLVTLFGVFKEALILEFLLASRAYELQHVQYFLDVSVKLARWLATCAHNSFERTLALPATHMLYAFFAVKSIALRTLQRVGLHDVIAHATSKQGDGILQGALDVNF